MNNIIKYYYNINVDNIKNIGQYYEFELNNIDYLFVPEEYTFDQKNYYLIKRSNPLSYDIIFNVNNLMTTKYNNKEYILLKLKHDYADEVILKELIQNRNIGIPDFDKKKLVSWGTLWSNKMDFYETQMREFGKKSRVILNTFSYYLGLAENAISYANYSESLIGEDYVKKVSICHRKLSFPLVRLNYYNPLNMIIDLDVRDYAEYLKMKFFYGDNENILDDVNFFVRNIPNDVYNLSMFYARLLYPSYYFILYDKVINFNENDDKIGKIASKQTNYESFLKEVYLIISKIKPIAKIDWLFD